MRKSFRDHHLLQALSGYSKQKSPVDLYLNKYFRDHSALGSNDRRFVGDTIYALIRLQSLLDYACDRMMLPVSWENRLKAYQEMDLNALSSDPLLPLHVRASLPLPFFNLLAEDWGKEKALEIALISNQRAPATIRVNPLKTTREALLEKWKGRFRTSLTSQSPLGIHFEETTHLLGLPEFQDGLFEIQDEGSQLLADLMNPEPGNQVLDYCAGSGGKSLAFAHKLNHRGQIFLHDIRESALEKARRRLRRAGIQNAQTLSSGSPHLKRLAKQMDWVLVDAPCSGSGTLRRNPDLKWKFSLEMMERLIQEQRTIFEQALSFLKPKGQIVYATCSLFAAENQRQINYFIDKFKLRLVGEPLQTLPTPGGMDGFFGAVLSHHPL